MAFLDRLTQGIGRHRLAVGHEDVARRRRQRADPSEQLVPVGVCRQRIELKHLSAKVRGKEDRSAMEGGTLADRVASFEKKVIREEMRRAGGNRTRAAKVLGLSRQGLFLKMQRLGVSKSEE